jgi:hypothetical protein
MRDTLLAFPSQFSLRIDIENPAKRVFAIRRDGPIWSIVSAADIENPSWVLVFRSRGVLERVLLMRTSLHQAFVERRVALKGSIPESIRLLRVFDVVFSYLLPLPRLLRSVTRSPVPLPFATKCARALGFVVRAPLWTLKKEFDLG